MQVRVQGTARTWGYPAPYGGWGGDVGGGGATVKGSRSAIRGGVPRKVRAVSAPAHPSAGALTLIALYLRLEGLSVKRCRWQGHQRPHLFIRSFMLDGPGLAAWSVASALASRSNTKV